MSLLARYRRRPQDRLGVGRLLSARAPDYDRAYRDAVLAVEAVVLPVAIPNNKRGSLGSAVAHIADTVDRWTVGGLDADQQASGVTMLAMLRTVWHSQERHAQADGTIREVSKTEAEAAVSLSVTIVHGSAQGWLGDLPDWSPAVASSRPTTRAAR